MSGGICIFLRENPESVACVSLMFTQEPAGLFPSTAASHGFTLLSVCPFRSGDRAGDTSDAKTYSSIMQTWLLALVVLALMGKHLFIMTLFRTLCLVSSQRALWFLRLLLPQVSFLFSCINNLLCWFFWPSIANSLQGWGINFPVSFSMLGHWFAGSTVTRHV